MEDSLLQLLISIAGSVLVSTGFWSFLQKHFERNDALTDMLIGLGHDRIIHLGSKYLDRGYITQYELDNLNNYLYKPYHDLGGNGTAAEIMERVHKLPIKITDN